MFYEMYKKIVAYLLGFIDATKAYGPDLFNGIGRVSVTVALETVLLRRNKAGEVEVYLIKRSEQETAYPGEWHSPGSAMRPGESVEDVVVRLCDKEFKVTIELDSFVANINNFQEKRGHFFTPVYLAHVKEGVLAEDETRGWFSVNSLPEPMVFGHANGLIQLAVESFLLHEAA